MVRARVESSARSPQTSPPHHELHCTPPVPGSGTAPLSRRHPAGPVDLAIEITPYREFFGMMPRLPDVVCLQHARRRGRPELGDRRRPRQRVGRRQRSRFAVRAERLRVLELLRDSHTVSHTASEPSSQPNITIPRPTMNPMLPFNVQWSPCGGCGRTNIMSVVFQGSFVIDSAILVPLHRPRRLCPDRDDRLRHGQR